MSGAEVLGVGLIGAGPVVQAIHLPTLARLGSLFRVRSVFDVRADIAETVAARVGAAWTTSLDELLADPAVDVVAVCSPHQFHATQVIAAMRAGKKAVLCEKPFAWNEAEAREIARVAEETGVPVIVGAMHTFDPGWTESADERARLLPSITTIRSTIVLPPNERFEDLGTELEGGRPPVPEIDRTSKAAQAALIRGGVLGLAIHDTPLIRALLPEWAEVEVVSATPVAPFGYVITLRAGDRVVALQGFLPGPWKPQWELEAVGPDGSFSIEFSPSYVHAGSATARTSSGRTFGPYEHNGYEGEWRALHRVVGGDADAAPPLDEVIDDFLFAVRIADRAEAAIVAQEVSA